GRKENGVFNQRHRPAEIKWQRWDSNPLLRRDLCLKPAIPHCLGSFICNQIFFTYRNRFNANKKLAAVGFEPTPPKRLTKRITLRTVNNNNNANDHVKIMEWNVEGLNSIQKYPTFMEFTPQPKKEIKRNMQLENTYQTKLSRHIDEEKWQASKAEIPAIISMLRQGNLDGATAALTENIAQATNKDFQETSPNSSRESGAMGNPLQKPTRREGRNS
ncbi:hypothetical protein L9F63_007359, partial [Diploptera punctata]